MPSKNLPVNSPCSFHVFLGTIPADTNSEEWFNTTARIGGHGISSGAGASISGVIPLTRSLLERVGSLEAETVLPYLRKELRWVIETVSIILPSLIKGRWIVAYLVEQDNGSAVDLDLLPMFRVRVASAEVGIVELKTLEWSFYESVVDGARGRLE